MEDRESAAGSWLQYGGGPGRVNCSAQKLAPPLRLAWKAKMGDYIHDSPLAAGKRVYLGSNDCTYRCWSLMDGTEIWCHKFDPENEKRGTLLVKNYPIAACLAEDVAVVGSNFGYLQAISLRDGANLWRRKISGISESTILSAGGGVVCSMRANKPEEFLLVSVDPASGEICWERRLDMRCFSLAAKGSVAIGVLEAGKLITSQGPGGAYSSTSIHLGHVRAFTLGAGETLWDREFPDPGIEPISLIYEDMVIVAVRGRGDVYALSLADGSILWTIPGQRMDAQPAVANGRLYIAADYLYAYDLATRGVIWQTKEGTRYKRSAPLVAGDYIFIGSGDSLDTEIHCRSVETGELVWRYKTGDIVFSTPTVVDGRLVIGSHDKHLYCFEGKSS